MVKLLICVCVKYSFTFFLNNTPHVHSLYLCKKFTFNISERSIIELKFFYFLNLHTQNSCEFVCAIEFYELLLFSESLIFAMTYYII